MEGEKNNPFERFGLTPAFDLDEGRLAERFRALQRAVHPDQYSHASDHERRQAVERAAAVNTAYQILRNPLRRARCLLALQGVSIEEVDTTVDPIFLTDHIELQEHLEEARDAQNPNAIFLAVQKTICERRAALLAAFAIHWNAATPASLQQAAEVVRQLRFCERMEERLHYLEEFHFESIAH